MHRTGCHRGDGEFSWSSRRDLSWRPREYLLDVAVVMAACQAATIAVVLLSGLSYCLASVAAMAADSSAADVAAAMDVAITAVSG